MGRVRCRRASCLPSTRLTNLDKCALLRILHTFSAYRIENGGYIHSEGGRGEQPTAAAAEWRNHFNFEIVYPLALHSTAAVKT